MEMRCSAAWARALTQQVGAVLCLQVAVTDQLAHAHKHVTKVPARHASATTQGRA